MRPLAALVLPLLLVPACAPPARIAPRDSPRPTLSDPLPAGAAIWAVDADHGGWAYEMSGTLEVHDEWGMIGSMETPSMLYLDVAPDRTAAVCTSDGVTVIADGSSTTTGVSNIPPVMGLAFCVGVGTRGAGDVWVVVSPAFDDDPRTAPPSRLCRVGARWSCTELPSYPQPGSLALTPTHAWWLTGGELHALDTSAVDAAVSVVATGLALGSLRPSVSTERVLFVPVGSTSTDQTARLIALDGSETSFVAMSEGFFYGEDQNRAGALHQRDCRTPTRDQLRQAMALDRTDPDSPRAGTRPPGSIPPASRLFPSSDGTRIELPGSGTSAARARPDRPRSTRCRRAGVRGAGGRRGRWPGGPCRARRSRRSRRRRGARSG
jgi:hypothetical protein